LLNALNAELMKVVSFAWIASRTAIIKAIELYSKKQEEDVVIAGIHRPGNSKDFVLNTMGRKSKS